MMPPGHIAATWAAAEWWPGRSLDYRWLAFSGLLPDLIDKPLALWLFTKSHSSQNVSHALIPNLLLLLGSLLWWRRGLPYVLAFNLHLLADRMWRHTETFWWPLYGWQTFWEFRFMNTPEAMVNVYIDIIRRYPRVWIVELLALIFLAWFAYRHGLFRWPILKQFVRTGRLTNEDRRI
jgi:hypothetical protein